MHETNKKEQQNDVINHMTYFCISLWIQPRNLVNMKNGL